MKNLKNLRLKHFKSWILAHKISSGIVLAVLVLGGYGLHKHLSAAGGTRYVVTAARVGNIETSVSGTGYVSSENQIDLKSKVSGDITQVNVKAGDKVTTGEIIAEVDARDALLALKSEELAYQKLTKPADPSDIQAAQDNLDKSYNDAWNAISNSYLSLPNILSGMQDMTSVGGYLSEDTLRYLSQVASDYGTQAGVDFYNVNQLYDNSLGQYKALDRSSAPKDIDNLLSATYNLVKQLADTLKDARNAINYISQQYPSYNSGSLTSASSDVNTWSTDVNSDLSALIAAQTSIVTNKKALSDLNTGADALDVQSAALSLEEKQDAYSDYFIKAPYDGVIARVGVTVGEAASGATIATIVSNRMFADIPLNEIDAANVKPGQKVRVTFDAVPGLTVDGLVESTDLVGTVSQGVVTYNVKISFAADDRVKPGMSTSADIVTSEKDGVVMVPASAVKSRGQQSYVLTFNPPLTGTKQELFLGVPSSVHPVQKPVQVGLSNDTDVEITSGLSEGDQVLVRTITTTAAPTTTTAPSLFGGGGAGNVRVGGGARPSGATRGQ